MNSKTKPQLSFWQIWNMSFGFLGIQFGFALQNANVSRIFETLGARIEDIPILWIAAPVTGLIIQPIIGHMSDKTWNRFGRRRPYFFVGAILASLALFLMPNSTTLWVAAGTLWIMDASINISMEPFRAFVGDMLPNRQRTLGFSMQSFFIGTGAIIASALPWMMTNWFGISNTAPEGIIPDSVHFSFYIGGTIFFLAVLYTVLKTKEYSPEQIQEFEALNKEKHAIQQDTKEELIKGSKFIKNGVMWLIISSGLFTIFYFYIFMDYGLGVFLGGGSLFGILQIAVGLLINNGNTNNGTVSIVNDLYKMPKTMKQLAFVQFFSWFALFSMWIYTTAGVTSAIYDTKIEKVTVDELVVSINNLPNDLEGEKWINLDNIKSDLGDLEAKYKMQEQRIIPRMGMVKFFLDDSKGNDLKLEPTTKKELTRILKEYNEGADWVGLLMAVYNGFAAIMAFLIIWLSRYISRKKIHSIALIVGGLSLISFYFISEPKYLMISELGIGLAWASILAMPYAILTGALPSNKMGTYMGIFNFFIVIPQITAAAILGFIVHKIFNDQAIYALIIGGISMIIAAFMMKFVDDK